MVRVRVRGVLGTGQENMGGDRFSHSLITSQLNRNILISQGIRTRASSSVPSNN